MSVWPRLPALDVLDTIIAEHKFECEVVEARDAFAELLEAAQAVENSCVRNDANDADLFRRLDAAIVRVKGGVA